MNGRGQPTAEQWQPKKFISRKGLPQSKLPLRLICPCGKEFEANVYPTEGLCPACICQREKARRKLHGMVFKGV